MAGGVKTSEKSQEFPNTKPKFLLDDVLSPKKGDILANVAQGLK